MESRFSPRQLAENFWLPYELSRDGKHLCHESLIQRFLSPSSRRSPLNSSGTACQPPDWRLPFFRGLICTSETVALKGKDISFHVDLCLQSKGADQIWVSIWSSKTGKIKASPSPTHRYSVVFRVLHPPVLPKSFSWYEISLIFGADLQ